MPIRRSLKCLSQLRILHLIYLYLNCWETPWEERSVAVNLANKVRKHERNKLWRRRKRQRISEMLAKIRDILLEINMIKPMYYDFSVKVELMCHPGKHTNKLNNKRKG